MLWLSILENRQIRLHQCRLTDPRQQPRWIRSNRDARRRWHLSIAQAEIPAVKRTNGAAIFNAAAGKIVPGVGADAVQHVNLAVVQKNRQPEAVDVHVPAEAFAQFVEIAQTDPAHGMFY